MQLSLSRVRAWRNLPSPSRQRQRHCLATSALCRITGNGATETVKIQTIRRLSHLVSLNLIYAIRQCLKDTRVTQVILFDLPRETANIFPHLGQLPIREWRRSSGYAVPAC